MRDVQRPNHISLGVLLSRMKEGRYVVPDFQREFEWEPWDIRELMRSIFLDYYIGSLLLWRSTRQHLTDLSCEPLYGFSGDGQPEYIVLDGQQRLTAMYYAFVAPRTPLPRRRRCAFYYMQVDRFMAEEYDEAFHYDWFVGERPPITQDRSLQYQRHIFPFAVIGSGGWELGNWVQGYEQYWIDEASRIAASGGDPAEAHRHVANARAFGEHLRAIVEQFQISYVELDRSIGIDKICDIFTQINSRGVRLDIFDLMNALLKPKGLQLKKLWREAGSRLSFVDTTKMSVYILQVMSILRQTYCSPKYLYYLLPGAPRSVREADGKLRKETLIPDVDDFEARWHVAVAAIERAIRALRDPRDFGVTSSSYLPYVSILPVFAALLRQVDELDPEQRLEGRRRFRLWYWASVFTNRYSGAVESTSARDFQDVRAWIRDEATEPASVAEFKQRFRALDLRGEVKRGTSIYNAMFNLLVIQGARDWISGEPPQATDLDDHHIVPSSWGLQHALGPLANSILNRTPLTAATNREVVRDRLPNVYLPELIRRSGRQEIERLMATHFISPAALDILLRTPFTPADFEAFLTERGQTMLTAIEDLLIQQRLDLPVALRELDQRIERVELDLRAAIDRAAGGDPGLLPPHVLPKIEDRLQRDLRKTPALDDDPPTTLRRRLEYADLRELQDCVCNKGLWGEFEARFGTKEGVALKFNQLADLRNGIRHSRAISEIVRKEGEAAVLWFEQALAKAPRTDPRQAAAQSRFRPVGNGSGAFLRATSPDPVRASDRDLR